MLSVPHAVRAEKRLRRRVEACTYDPLPRELRDIAAVLATLEETRADLNDTRLRLYRLRMATR